MATLSAWPPILSNEAPREGGMDEIQKCSGEDVGGRVMGTRAKRNHENEVRLDKGKQWEVGKMDFSMATLET